MNEFLESIIKRDPAAKSKLSIILTYPGAKAIFFHKIANFFAIAKFQLIAAIYANPNYMRKYVERKNIPLSFSSIQVVSTVSHSSVVW